MNERQVQAFRLYLSGMITETRNHADSEPNDYVKGVYLYGATCFEEVEKAFNIFYNAAELADDK